MTVSMQLTDSNAAEMRLWVRRHGGTTAVFLDSPAIKVWDLPSRTWKPVEVGDWVVVEEDGYMFTMRELPLPMPEVLAMPSPEVMVTKHRTVFDIESVYRDHAVFHQLHDRNETFHAMLVRYATWADMDRPETITVTIEPGDLLNQ
jgi:hypothetical protein